MPDMIAISESTPGPIGVNMATYCGYNAGFLQGGIGFGMLYGLAATLSLVLPSLITIIIVARILDKFQKSTLVDNAFKGLRPAVTALIAYAGLGVLKDVILHVEAYLASSNWLDLVRYKELIFFALLLYATNKWKKHPIFYIAVSAVVGIVFKLGA